MFGYADVEKLRGACAPESAVLSLYLAVPRRSGTRGHGQRAQTYSVLHAIGGKDPGP